MSRLPRTEALLVLACAAATAMLAASQFMTMFELTPTGGEPLETVSSADQHGYAILVLAVFSLAMLLVGIGAQSEQVARIAAFAVAAGGAVALLIFLVGDLPDANKVGTLDDDSFIDAKAEPQAGFWLELAGSLVLAVCGGALATLGPEKLNLRQGERRSGGTGEEGATNGAKPSGEDPAETAEKRGPSFNWPTRR
ncbi:MAG: hypothetical protein ACXWZW_12785 [Solirubrobacterales bacterium]